MNEFEVKHVNIINSIALSQEKLCVYQLRTAIALEKIAQILEESRPRSSAPNYQALLENWHHYDWEKIGAEIELTDNYGVASVIWQGDRFKRRSPSNAYDTAIFFSRCVGKSEDGTNQYERLITFKPFADLKVEPISRKAENIINQNGAKI
jgi:DdrB-like protein